MKTTLQTRLISLLVLSSLFLVSAFAAIQLNNQIEKTSEFNIYQARQESLVARDKLQEIFETYKDPSQNNALVIEAKNILKGLLDSGTIETASLLNKDAFPVVLEGNLQLFFEDEKSFISDIAQSHDTAKWLTPVVDKKHKLVNLFVSFKNAPNYVLKLTFQLSNVQKALNAVYVPVIFTIVIVIIGNIILGVLLSWALITPIKILNEATKDVANGNLDLKIHINTKDELEELSDTFNYMTIELKKMKEKAENANPLTKLPGNIVIREEVEKRIGEGKKFVLVYCDLDHFKAFNDKYGVHAGDKAIMLTADIFKDAVSKEGTPEDFIGHEGGDDFLLLTVPERTTKLTDYIIKEFDKKIRSLYSKEDIDKGYIEAKGRESDSILKFPIMSISLAGVSNMERDITSFSEITNTAAEIKKVAKKKGHSNFVLDKRLQDMGAEFRSNSSQH